MNSNLPSRLTYRAFLVSMCLILVGCNLPVTAQVPTEPPAAFYTQAAQTIIAGLTQSAPQPAETDTQVPAAETPSVTETPAGTEPPPPTETSPPTETQPPATETEAAETETPEPDETQTPGATSTAVLTGTVVFEEDFEDETGWFTETNNQFSAGFTDGAYRIEVNIPEATVWSVRELDYDDVILEVDIARTDGPDSGYYGLICRQREDENYYVLAIGGNGFYGIAKSEDGELEFLEDGTDQEGILQTGESANRIRAECIGETLALSVNGQELLEVQDDDFPTGDIGLAVGTRGEPGVEAVFDNFVVIEPD